MRWRRRFRRRSPVARMERSEIRDRPFRLLRHSRITLRSMRATRLSSCCRPHELKFSKKQLGRFPTDEEIDALAKAM
jgi:hypothetical protein